MFEVAQILLSKYNVMGQESYKIGVTSQTCPEEKKKKKKKFCRKFYWSQAYSTIYIKFHYVYIENNLIKITFLT